MKSATATEIKRHVGDNLYLADVDGTPWATNRYWMAPAEKLAPLLDKFNVDPKAGGHYEVNGSVRKQSDDAPKMATFLKVEDYTQALEPLRVSHGDGRHAAYTRTGDGHYLAMFTRPDGAAVGVRADWLEWLADSPPYHYGEQFGNVRYAMTEKPSGVIAILADKQVKHGGIYEDGEDGHRHFVPETWEATGTVVLAVVMSCKPA